MTAIGGLGPGVAFLALVAAAVGVVALRRPARDLEFIHAAALPRLFTFVSSARPQATLRGWFGLVFWDFELSFV